MNSHLRYFAAPEFPLLSMPESSYEIQNDYLLLTNLLYLQGFSITEVQKKQAMVNASKQHHTGKPKGKSHLNIQMLPELQGEGGSFCIYYMGVVSM